MAAIPPIDPNQPVGGVERKPKDKDRTKLKKRPHTPQKAITPAFSLEDISVVNARYMSSVPLMSNEDANKNPRFLLLKSALEKKTKNEMLNELEIAALIGVEQILSELISGDNCSSQLWEQVKNVKAAIPVVGKEKENWRG